MDDVTPQGILLSAMDRDAVAALFADARALRFAKGEMIFGAGDPGGSVILIDSGRVEVSMTDVSGRKSVLAHMGPGEVLGEIAALDGGPRSADAVAARAVAGRIVLRAALMRFVGDRPEVARAIIAALCGKVRNATEMYAVQALTDGGPRLARALLRLFDQWGEGDRLAERFSQGDIGEFSGLARENVNRQIKAWEAEGLLRIDGRDLVLVDRVALAGIAAL